MILLNMIWPALYVSQTFWKFWFLIVGTLIIETFLIKYLLRYSWQKSFLASFVGNAVSAFAGTFCMMYGMILWHALVDNFLPQATFDPINWVATYSLMCLGSVFFEVIVVSILFKERVKRLMLPLLVGNLLSYAFIAYAMVTAPKEGDEIKRIQTVHYLPQIQDILLLDSSMLHIDTAYINVYYDENDSCLNEIKYGSYTLHIPFKEEDSTNFQFEMRLVGDKYSDGRYNTSKDIKVSRLEAEYKVVLEQKNPDKDKGWRVAVITDTLVFGKLVE